MKTKLTTAILSALLALATVGTALADPPTCPPGLERHGNRCEAPGSGQTTGTQPSK